MNNIFQNISAGAKFVRADLHIHSFGDEGSYDVYDAEMTPENIVDKAVEQNLSVIAITDHNEIGNVKRALKHAEGKNLLVIPGIEISTIQGHLLIYFEEFQHLKNFRGKLTINENRERCSQGISECLTLAEQYNGIGVLAHVELPSGFEKTIGRYGPSIEEVICHPNVWGLEISSKNSITFYTDKDDSTDRKRLIGMKRVACETGDFEFPLLMSSDAHTLARLGTNAEGENKLTRLKMDSLCFHGFKVALQNASSRIRLENLIPERTPKFVGIQIEGGLLDKQNVHFSNNLTCIIGGRGAGKSTMLECIRETSGNRTDSKIVDSDVWPEKISLLYEDETGQQIVFSREKNGPVINVNDPANGIGTITIESYGQGETAETIQHSDNNPKTLLAFLDSFIELNALKEEEEESRQLLIQSQSEIVKLRVEVAGIPETERQKLHLEGKLQQLQKDKVGDLVKYQTALLRERSIRSNLISDLKTLIARYKDILDDNSVFKTFTALTDKEIIVGKDNFNKVKQIVAEFANIVSSKSGELKISLGGKITELNAQLKEWGEKESTIQAQIDSKKAELAAKGIPFDIGKINQIAQDVTYYQDRLRKLQSKKSDLDALIKERAELLLARRRVKDKIFFNRMAFAKIINENLKNSVDGFFVDLKFEQGKYSPDFEESIKLLMQWRTSQVPKAKYLCRTISPFEFAIGIKKSNLDILKSVLDQDGTRIFSDLEIVSIIDKAKVNSVYEDFESICFEDLPVLTVTKIITVNGVKKRVSRSLSQLSLGQQQSILLAILLQSKSKVPLVIDQPEDNLDSEFIYKTIVSNLRKIKENRQVIIVTHNANIAVLGDAELIIPLKSTNAKSVISDSGSIDRKETRSICCDILEGGKQAFLKRKMIYGH